LRAAGVSWSAPAHTMRARSRYGLLVEGDIDRSALRFNLPDLTEEPFPLLALLLVERSRRFNGTQGYLNRHFNHFVTIDRHVTSSINDALKYDLRNSPAVQRERPRAPTRWDNADPCLEHPYLARKHVAAVVAHEPEAELHKGEPLLGRCSTIES